MSWSVEIWGCESLETAFASRSTLCFSDSSDDRCAGNTLRATSRSRRESWARYTSPSPPAPSGDWISYGPSFVPEARGIRARHYSRRPQVDVVSKLGWRKIAIALIDRRSKREIAWFRQLAQYNRAMQDNIPKPRLF